jgi:hypothetical protein
MPRVRVHSPLHHVVAVNARSELLASGRGDAGGLRGLNGDWRAECAETGVALRILASRGRSVDRH